MSVPNHDYHWVWIQLSWAHALFDHSPQRSRDLSTPHKKTGYSVITRSVILSAAQLLMSSHRDMQAEGARRARMALWTDAIAQHAAEVHLDELLLVLVRPDTPDGAGAGCAMAKGGGTRGLYLCAVLEG
jgi:hypothetical protein